MRDLGFEILAPNVVGLNMVRKSRSRSINGIFLANKEFRFVLVCVILLSSLTICLFLNYSQGYKICDKIIKSVNGRF